MTDHGEKVRGDVFVPIKMLVDTGLNPREINLDSQREYIDDLAKKVASISQFRGRVNICDNLFVIGIHNQAIFNNFVNCFQIKTQLQIFNYYLGYKDQNGSPVPLTPGVMNVDYRYTLLLLFEETAIDYAQDLLEVLVHIFSFNSPPPEQQNQEEQSL